MSELVFLDLETTGLNPTRHQVWEAAYAVGVDGDVQTSFLPHGLENADPAALHFNNYVVRAAQTQMDMSKALMFEGAFKAALQGATVVAANPAFDMAFLFARWGEAPWHYRLLDIEAYAMPLLGYDRPQGLNTIVKDLRERGHEIYTPDHTARADVLCLRDCYKALVSLG